MKDKTLGAVIAERRRALELTQAQLAEKMGVTDKAVSKWERDLSCPDVDSLPRLASIFGVSLDELLRVKASAQHSSGKTAALVPLILKAVALAMGVSVTVLSILRSIDLYSGFTMLGIGLACMGVSVFAQHEEKDD